ncbi:mechanosensitive ion channel domain-containing protein [Marinospirillum alkaliphilum]|uniref:Small-conductance mechanosensitive channel n=1 Tax=Marinospirillum alkaliphilum DSM 21637 TaxID=1122209 RepID=A0A1K1X674_9GAMM|nr:mechanosensitive ion channel domain-containing protein [Marinospirillum alkaliphilum]SFX45110.1 Small-conductance mechanosensitive channel [Marinospirillum alkaliphilum DSM 21637]
MPEPLLEFIGQFSISSELIRLLLSTLVLLVAMLVLRAIGARLIRRSVESTELRRKWLVQSRNGLLLLTLLGLFMIWGEELRTLALSVVAIAVAFVVATKELILCVTGGLLKTGARSFDIGDRIQIKDFRGDVIDQNLLVTTILEVGPGKLTHQRTGRMIVLPNALFVSEPVINESFTHDYVLHVFTVPFMRKDHWREAQQQLLESAQKHCAPYLENVRRHMNRVASQRGLEVPTVEPRVSLQFPEPDEVHLVVRVPAKAAQRSYIEQSILAEVFEAQDYLAAAKPSN